MQKIFGINKKVCIFAALSRPTEPFGPEIAKGEGLKFFLKIFKKDLEECKKFLPLQPASETEPFIDIMKTSSKTKYKVFFKER